MALISPTITGRTARPETHFGNDNDKNKFQPIMSGKGRNEKYFTLVDKKTGEITIYNNEFGWDRVVGTYDPSKKDLKLKDGARLYEKEAFGDPDSGALDTVIKNSKNMIQKECFNDATNEAVGVSKQDRLASCKKMANDLMNDGTTDIDPLEGSTMRGVAKEEQEKLMAVKGRKFFPNLRYPEKMREDQDAIKFTIRDFTPREWDETQPGVLKERDRSNAALQKFNMGSVILPVPGTITDTNKMDWKAEDLNPLEAVGAQLALAAFDGADAAGGLMKNLAKDMGASDMTDVAAQGIAGQIVGKGGQLIKRSKGAVINPNIELLFNKPELRDFKFDFNLSPRNAKEAQTIKQIIRLFKQSSAPRRTIKGYFLRTPLIYQIEYINNAYNLNRFKECALTDFTTNYTPNNTYSTFRDGTMTQYKISMSFKEIDPIFNDDYDMLDKEDPSNLSSVSLAGGQGPLAAGNLEGGPDSAGIGY